MSKKIKIVKMTKQQAKEKLVNDYYKEAAIALVHAHFEGDNAKALDWFCTVNPLLGDIKPTDMMHFGRSKKLFWFIVDQMEENTL